MPKQRTDGSRGFSEATEIFLESLQAWLSKSTRKDLQLSPEPPINPSDDGSEIAATLKSPAKQYYLTLVRYRDSYDQTCICVRAAELGQFRPHTGLFKRTIVATLERERITNKNTFFIFALCGYVTSST
jgi:hypothetical protein